MSSERLSILAQLFAISNIQPSYRSPQKDRRMMGAFNVKTVQAVSGVLQRSEAVCAVEIAEKTGLAVSTVRECLVMLEANGTAVAERRRGLHNAVLWRSRETKSDAGPQDAARIEEAA